MAKKKKRRYKKKSYSTILLLIMCFIFLITGISAVIKTYDNYQKEKPTQDEIVEQQKNDFIEKISPYALELRKEYGILPSITISQAILESDWGKSKLASEYNNYFGVKGTNPSNTKVLTTKEFVNGKWIVISGRFRIYSDFKESMKDHAILLANGTTWNSKQYQHVLSAQDYVDGAFALQNDGYATDPSYTKKLLKIIKQYDLGRFDK